jgi:hypothetical protein
MGILRTAVINYRLWDTPSKGWNRKDRTYYYRVAKSKDPEEFEDAELKHLEFIQGIISRLAQNSFLLRGWSVTLVAGIHALASRNPSIYLVGIAILPALAFWGLDAFYLGQERNLRQYGLRRLLRRCCTRRTSCRSRRRWIFSLRRRRDTEVLPTSRKTAG